MAQAQKQKYTLDDFKKGLKYYQQKLQKLELEQTNLMQQVFRRTNGLGEEYKDFLIDYYKKLRNSSEKIQAHVKGFIQRKKFRETLLEHLQSKQPRSSANNHLNSDEELVKYFKNKLMDNFGLTFEIIFRALDLNQQQVVSVESFKVFLSSYKDFFTNCEIQKLSLILDPECTNVIYRYQLANVLALTGQQTETTGEETIDKLTINKLRDFLIAKKISPEQLFNTAAASNNKLINFDVIPCQQLLQLLKKLELELTYHEQMVITNLFSFENQIEKNFFIKKLSQILQHTSGYNPQQVQLLQSQQQQNVNQQQQPLIMEEPKEKGEQSQPQQQQGGNLAHLNQAQFPKFNQPPNLLQTNKQFNKQVITEKDLSPIFEKLKDQNKPIYQFLEDLLQSVNLSVKTIRLADIGQQIDKQYPKLLTKKEKGLLLNGIDSNQDGTVDLNEITMFFRKFSQEKQISLRLVILLLAKRLEVEDLSTADYFKQNSLSQERRFNIDEFNKFVGPLFGLEGENANRLFLELDSNRKGIVLGKDVLNLIDNFRSDKPNPLARLKQTTNQQTQMIEEMKIFKEKLEKCGFALNTLWTMVDQNEKGLITLLQLKNGLKQIFSKLPQGEIPDSQINFWIKIIDINNNSIIDRQEYELLTATADSDLTAFRYVNDNEDNDAEEEQEILKYFAEQLRKFNLTPIQLFNFIDESQNGSISLIEMKKALALLGVDFRYLIKLIKIFDFNQDGDITKVEFMQVLSKSGVTEQAIQIKTIIGSGYDERADSTAIERLDKYGAPQNDELKDAMIKFQRFIQDQGPNVEGVYKKLFSEFDVNLDYELSRQEFLSGLDKYNKKLMLTDRQKIRLMTLADSNNNNKINFEEFMNLLKQLNSKSIQKNKENIAFISEEVPNTHQGSKKQKPEYEKKQIKENKQDYEKTLIKIRNYEVNNSGKLESLENQSSHIADDNRFANKNTFIKLVQSLNIGLDKLDYENLDKYLAILQNNEGKLDLDDFFVLIKNIKPMPSVKPEENNLDEASTFLNGNNQ